jgi:hypothetical protein
MMIRTNTQSYERESLRFSLSVLTRSVLPIVDEKTVFVDNTVHEHDEASYPRSVVFLLVRGIVPR